MNCYQAIVHQKSRPNCSSNSSILSVSEMATAQSEACSKYFLIPQNSRNVLTCSLLFLTSILLVTIAEKTVEKYRSGSNQDYEAAVQFLEKNNEVKLALANKVSKATWNYESDLKEENKKVMLDFEMEQARFSKETWKKIISFAWKDFKNKNETVYRWFKHLSVLGVAALPEAKLNALQALTADMQDIYSKTKVCEKGSKNCTMNIEPDLAEKMKTLRNYDELKYIWASWRNVTGRKVKKMYGEYVKLSNEAAVLNGYKDNGEMWQDAYESDTFVNDVEGLLKLIDPFYKHLHAYVRRKLIQKYPDKGIQPDGPIPAHLLGNMWAQNWMNIFDIVKPFPKKKLYNSTQTMIDKGMTPLSMFKLAEDFFVSLGLYPMTQEFWNRSIIEKPKDREIVCHASAWDFYDGKDFRIKMCTRVNMEDLLTVHHEMGHVQYYQQYAHQAEIFRAGANPGFHEAIGDTMALSVVTLGHLKKINLVPADLEDDEEVNINHLMRIALETVAFLPFGYLIDLYRWKIFSGEIQPETYNSRWWELRLKYQGICPPVTRTEDDFDAGSKYHVVADVPYMRYFVSHIILFQFHKSLCDAAGYKGLLHNCDIYQNKEAGKLLSDVLKLGSSVHWSEVMNVITRGKTKKIDTQPLLEYFEPLIKWLKKQNEKEILGWKSCSLMVCPGSS